MPLAIADAPARSPAALRAVLFCLWILTMLTFTPLEREDVTSAASLDFLAMAKLAARLTALLVLGWLVLRGASDARAGRLLAPLGFYLLWALLSTVWSPLKSMSLGQSLSLANLFLLSWCLAIYAQAPESTSRILGHAVAAHLFFSLCLLGAFFTLGSGSNDRFAFAIAHPTMAGASASMGVIMTLAAVTIWRCRWAKPLAGPALVTHALVLLLAHNRTAILVTALVVMLLIASFADRRALAVAALLGSLATIAIATFDPGWTVATRGMGETSEFLMREQHQTELLAFSGRDELWKIMWESYLSSPWIGHGYFVSSSEGVLDIWNRATNFNAHNMPFQALVSTGLIGCLLFVWGMLQPLGYALGNLGWSNETNRRAGLFVLLSVWVWMWGLMDAALLGPVAPFCVMFFVALGLLGGAHPPEEVPDPPRHQFIAWRHWEPTGDLP